MEKTSTKKEKNKILNKVVLASLVVGFGTVILFVDKLKKSRYDSSENNDLNNECTFI